MDAVINLKSKFNKTHLKQLKSASPDKISKTYMLVTTALYVTDTRVKGGHLSIEPDGGPTITEGELLEGNMVKYIQTVRGNYIITFT